MLYLCTLFRRKCPFRALQTREPRTSNDSSLVGRRAEARVAFMPPSGIRCDRVAERVSHLGSEVEQRIRNAWVPSSNLGGGSKKGTSCSLFLYHFAAREPPESPYFCEKRHIFDKNSIFLWLIFANVDFFLYLCARLSMDICVSMRVRVRKSKSRNAK